MYSITINTGTTNTSMCLWSDFIFVSSVQRSVGVRHTSIDGHNKIIIQGLADAFKELLLNNKLKENDIGLVIASGMITSNLGLVEVPHLLAPASISNFADNIQKAVITEVTTLPIHFIPGLKNRANVNGGSLEEKDFMRGEEVETLALLDLTDQSSEVIFILPGSHTKFVALNDQLQMIGCCTSIAGELTSIITQNTVLTNSLQGSFTDVLDYDYLKQGADCCQQVGVTRSLFSIRVLEQTAAAEQNQLASFLLGIILSEDIKALLSSKALMFRKGSSVGVYGSNPVAQAFKFLLTKEHAINTFMVDESVSHNLSGHGCLLIAKEAGLL